MNFLAHLYLSGDDEGVMTGNFMADRIKGEQAYAFDPAITRGILLHRFIDTFTDNHEVVMQSKKRLYSKYHKYAPVIVDIFYDHFLASEFEKHSDELLMDFSRNCYDVLSKNMHLMPQRIQFFLPYMIRHNWLNSYAEIEGAGRALAGLAGRSRFNSNMQNAVYDLVEDYDLYKNEFRDFFPDLKKYSRDFLKVNSVVF
jgi:acyl carrier protein phosphodiesterase